MENKFYSLLDVKSIDDTQRIIKGIATDVSPDHVGDRIDLQGIELTGATVPLLIQHDHDLPIGTVTDLQPTAKGLMMTAKLPTKVDSPELQKRIDTAYSEIKEGLRTGLSIGFIGLDWDYLADDTRLFTKIKLLEVSVVTIGCNPRAGITEVKRLAQTPTAKRKAKSSHITVKLDSGKGVALPPLPLSKAIEHDIVRAAMMTSAQRNDFVKAMSIEHGVAIEAINSELCKYLGGV